MTGKMRHLPMIASIAALCATGVLTSSCAQIRTHQGYLSEPILIESIQPGVDNRASVQATLGRPTFTSQFTADNETPTWYYVSRESRQLAFARPRPVAQAILAVQFADDGNVATVDLIGMEQVASINPSGDETPTLGRNRGFFQELFGNIGRVGSIGQGSSTADNPGG